MGKGLYTSVTLLYLRENRPVRTRTKKKYYMGTAKISSPKGLYTSPHMTNKRKEFYQSSSASNLPRQRVFLSLSIDCQRISANSLASLSPPNVCTSINFCSALRRNSDASRIRARALNFTVRFFCAISAFS